MLITEPAQGQVQVFDVMKYSASASAIAIAGGNFDNSEVFGKAWNDACRWNGNGAVVRDCCWPLPTKLSSTLTIGSPLNILMGRRSPEVANCMPEEKSLRHYNDCHKNNDCKSLSVSHCHLSTRQMQCLIDDITSINNKMFHFNKYDNQNISISHVNMLALADSPNTDGIHIGRSSNNIRVLSSVIGTGDDCISLKQGSRDILIQDVHCGPGHGICIGSLGMNEGEEEVRGITVSDCTVKESDDGMRIKTWADSFTINVASDVTFENIVIENVRNPIIIDQDYCPHPPCNQGQSAVQIKNVKLREIRRTSSSKVAVSLMCSKACPCSDVELHDIDLAYNGQDGPAIISCRYVNGVSSRVLRPPSCM